MKETLPILYQDEHMIAVNKPSGLLVHRTRLDIHETRFALQIVRDMAGRYVYPVHRLDKPTSGILLFALDRNSASTLGEMFRTGKMVKKYLAVVRGFTEERGIVDHPLNVIIDKMERGKIPEERQKESAVTEYQRLATAELPLSVDNRYPTSRFSLLEVHPETGRRRQIRRHLKHISHPIIGDVNYGRGEYNRFFREYFDCARLLLAAVELAFDHPWKEERTTIRAPLDITFIKVLKQLGWLDVMEKDLIPE
jgi:tRNA pseudouridine65 synthase